MIKTIVIGGGAAGMMSAISAAQSGCDVLLLEKNEKLGKKIYITGKGRCNFTNACDAREFSDNVMSNPRFFYSAFHAFSNYDAMAFFEENGMPVKVERGGRAFPVSDHASDVTKALAARMRELHVKVRLNTEVKEIETEPCEAPATGKKKPSFRARVTAVKLTSGERLTCDTVIVATGGLSYPTTGSTGDGYRFAKAAGHTVTRLVPSLVSLVTEEEYPAEISGLTLKNISVRFEKNGQVLYEDFGELLFTHKGVSGPVILSATGTASDALTDSTLRIDLKPALSEEQLDARLVRELSAAGAKQMKNFIGAYVPASLGPVILNCSGIDPEQRCSDLTKERRAALLKTLKGLSLHIFGMGGYNAAVVTKGGINVDEVNPSTMESKLVKGLRFAGEVLDLDALTGGFNLQIAWSTGFLAGRIREEKEKVMKNTSINIAIDGPAGAGKSTIAKAVAKRLGYIYVDTGAMYRTIALYLLRKGISADDAEAISKAGRECEVSLDYVNGEQQVLLFGENVSGLIRTEEVGNMASASSVNKDVRDKMADLQRELAATKNVVMDGRDIGTNVLPNAQVKVYLTASIEERARRRVKEYEMKGIEVDYVQVAKDIAERDYRDMHREHAPLCRAEDAVLLDTSDMTIEEVEDAMIRIVEEKLGKKI